MLTAKALKKALAVELSKYGYEKGEIHNKNKFLYAILSNKRYIK